MTGPGDRASWPGPGGAATGQAGPEQDDRPERPQADPRPEPTGDHRVDRAMADLAGVAQRPPVEQIAAYEAAHEALRATLSSIEES